MKLIIILTILFSISTTAHARKVCGIEVGDVPILVASEACHPKSLTEFRELIKELKGTARSCKIGGKTILAIKTDKMTGAIDYTTVKTVVNYHCKNGCTSRYCNNNYLTN